MKLNIYQKNEIIKTYETRSYDLMFGTVEDIANAINLDGFNNTENSEELITFVGNFVLNSMDLVKDLMKDIFPEITDEELKQTKVKELVEVLIEVVLMTFAQLRMFPKAGNEKN